jgi:hypothetical protein
MWDRGKLSAHLSYIELVSKLFHFVGPMALFNFRQRLRNKNKWWYRNLPQIMKK